MTCARRIPAVPLALATLLCVFALSCYRPNITNGGFKCNKRDGSSSGSSKECPDGYVCDWDNLCKKARTDAGPEVSDGNPDQREGGIDADAQPDMGQQCFQPRANCDPPDGGGGTCDPFCQTGCSGCKQKCSVNTLGALTCNDVVPGMLRNEFQSCTINGIGTAAQTDACAPGLVCLEDACGGGGGLGRCYKYCRVDADCPDSQCYRALPGGLRVCDVYNVDTCNPTVAQTGCGTGQGCYIAIARPSHTVCDCPGDKNANSFCEGSRSCFPGLLCVDPNGSGAICLKVCELSLSGADCGALGSCRPYSGNTGGAMTHPKYGYCF
jgi:hypothetical protein